MTGPPQIGVQLEVHLHSKLQEARIARILHQIKNARGHIRRSATAWTAWLNGIGVVESVKGFQPQLAVEVLGELHVLEEA
jgi:hypothetical protein